MDHENITLQHRTSPLRACDLRMNLGIPTFQK